jgi:hypothetical protein
MNDYSTEGGGGLCRWNPTVLLPSTDNRVGNVYVQNNDSKAWDGSGVLPKREKWDRSSLKTLWTEMESTLDSGSYWILQRLLVIHMLLGMLLLLFSMIFLLPLNFILCGLDGESWEFNLPWGKMV